MELDREQSVCLEHLGIAETLEDLRNLERIRLPDPANSENFEVTGA